MHELSVTQNIMNVVMTAVEQQKLTKIHRVRIAAGPLFGLVPDCVQIYFDMLSEGTPAEGARVIVKILPLKVRCRGCGNESMLKPREFACPVCGGEALQKLGGMECIVENIEAE